MNNSIHHFIQELQRKCSLEHKEYGYLIPPNVVKQGNEIKGEIPIWYEIPKHQHMKCLKPNCKDCFLLSIEDQFDQVIQRLEADGIPPDDISVILTL